MHTFTCQLALPQPFVPPSHCLLSHLGLNLGDSAAAGEQLEAGMCWAPASWLGHSDILKLFPGITARVSGLLLICLSFNKPLSLHAQPERTQSLSPRGGLSGGARIDVFST